MLRILLLVVFCMPLYAVEWLAPDFFVETRADFTVQEEPVVQGSCRDHISQVICLVASFNGEDVGEKRTCLEGGQSYAHYFEELYDNLPEVLQKMFCSLDVIYIEKEFYGTAYAGVIRDFSGKIRGAKMGVRKSVLDEALPFSLWASWKEQLSFGGRSDAYVSRPDLPRIEASSSANLNFLLYIIIAHEFGHIFDFTNDLNVQSGCDEFFGDCGFKEGSFGRFSWRDENRPQPAFDYVGRDKMCFYGCGGNFAGADTIGITYEAFYNSSNFISTYASTGVYDDFADSLAYFVADRYLQASYEYIMPDGKRYDMMAKLHADNFKTKYDYIDAFLKRQDIRYPKS